MDVDDERRPWERQSGEPAIWYHRFWAWLHHPKRSMLAVYREVWEEQQKRKAEIGGERRKDPPMRVPGSWDRAAKLWAWPARAEAYDGYLDSIATEAVERAARILRENAPLAAHTLVDGLQGNIGKEQRQSADSILNRSGLPATKRLDHTGKIEQRHTHAGDFGGLSDERLDDLIRHLQAAEGNVGPGTAGEGQEA